MNEFLITIVFIIVLVFGVYSYATYLTKSGKAEDADEILYQMLGKKNLGGSFRLRES